MKTETSDTAAGCPKCGAARAYSVESVMVHFLVTLSPDDDGIPERTYVEGAEPMLMLDTSERSDKLRCASCDHLFSLFDAVNIDPASNSVAVPAEPVDPPVRGDKITLRLSATEKAQVAARAKARGLSTSTYLRALGLGLLEA